MNAESGARGSLWLFTLALMPTTGRLSGGGPVSCARNQPAVSPWIVRSSGAGRFAISTCHRLSAGSDELAASSCQPWPSQYDQIMGSFDNVEALGESKVRVADLEPGSVKKPSQAR